MDSKPPPSPDIPLGSDTDSWTSVVPSCFGKVQDKLESNVRHSFYSYGYMVGQYPWQIFSFGVIVAVLCSLGLQLISLDGAAGAAYVPSSAPGRIEDQKWASFHKRRADLSHKEGSDKIDGFEVWITAWDGGDLIARPDYLDMLLNLVDFIENVPDPKHGLKWSDICDQSCETNAELLTFLRVYKTPALRGNTNFKLTYPVVEYLGNRIFIGGKLFGVEMHSPDNRTIVGSKLVVFNFGTVTKNDTTLEIFKLWAARVYDILNSNRHPYTELHPLFMTASLIDKAIMDTGTAAIPLFSIAGVSVLLFSLITTVRSDMVRSKPWIVVLGLLLPVFGIMATFGLMFACGLEFQSICVISMFLAMGVGVDDMYLMLHAWHSATPTRTDTQDIKRRMAETLADSGPSITISSLTNMLSFIVGISSDTPAIRTFCIYTATSIFVCYFLQLTYFAGALVLAGRLEKRGYNSILCCIRWENVVKDEKETGFSPVVHLQSCYVNLLQTISVKYDQLLQHVAAAYTHCATPFCLLIFMAMYMVLNGWAISLSKVDMSMDKLMLPQSPVWYFIQWEKQHRDVGGIRQLHLIVQKPGDLRNETRLLNMMDLIVGFENLDRQYSAGADSTFCWLKDYMQDLSFRQSPMPPGRYLPIFTYEHIPKFLNVTANTRYKFSMIYNETECVANSPKCLTDFYFITGIYTPEDWHQSMELADSMRAHADSYLSEFNTTAYWPRAWLVDQVATVWPTTWRTVFITLAAMICVCILFVPDVMSILCATLSVFSINLGVFGLSTLWGVYLDPITGVALLMSIGFSVDFTAHITYHYFKGHAETPYDRVLEALRSIAWPMVQAGASTALCASVMSMHRAYLILTFMKIILLVVLLGLFHGLIVLPVFLATLPFSKTSRKSTPEPKRDQIEPSPS